MKRDDLNIWQNRSDGSLSQILGSLKESHKSLAWFQQQVSSTPQKISSLIFSQPFMNFLEVNPQREASTMQHIFFDPYLYFQTFRTFYINQSLAVWFLVSNHP